MRCHQAKQFVSLAVDRRLEPAAAAALQEHLRACPSCRAWQETQAWLGELIRVPQELEPSPAFRARLLRRIEGSGPLPLRVPLFLRPALLRAAALLLFICSALLGMFLGGRLDAAPGGDAAAAAVSQALNLDAFADRPAESFGAVYERLLRGELQ